MVGNILVVVVVFAILIFIHELGHLLACKLAGIKVEKFSLGFGPPIVKWRRNETTYMISWVPLGGYIKMEGEDYGATGFFSEPLGKKVMVLVTGPSFNLLLGFLLLVVLFAGFGMRVPEPRIAPVEGSPAQVAGLRKGDLVLSLDSDSVRSFYELDSLLVSRSAGRNEVGTRDSGLGTRDSRTPSSVDSFAFRVRRADSVLTIHVFGQSESLGIDPFYRPIVGTVKAGGPAATAGIRPGDRFLKLDTVVLEDWTQFTTIVRASAQKHLTLTWLRGSDTMTRAITPQLGDDLATGEKVGQIGVEVSFPRVAFPLGRAILEALGRTASVTVKTFVILYELVSGKVSARAVSGPVMVAKIAYEGAQWGAEMLLALWAMLSINLFVINMLPVPFLDGGRAVLFVFEGVRRRKLSPREWDVALRIGLHLLVLLVVFALSNDFLNLVTLKARALAIGKKVQLALIVLFAAYGLYDILRPPAKKKEEQPPDPKGDQLETRDPNTDARGKRD